MCIDSWYSVALEWSSIFNIGEETALIRNQYKLHLFVIVSIEDLCKVHWRLHGHRLVSFDRHLLGNESGGSLGSSLFVNQGTHLDYKCISNRLLFDPISLLSDVAYRCGRDVSSVLIESLASEASREDADGVEHHAWSDLCKTHISCWVLWIDDLFVLLLDELSSLHYFIHIVPDSFWRRCAYQHMWKRWCDRGKACSLGDPIIVVRLILIWSWCNQSGEIVMSDAINNNWYITSLIVL